MHLRRSSGSEPSKAMKNWQAIVVGLVIGFLGGVGSMQATIIGDVHEHTMQINHMKEKQTEMTKLWEATLEQQQQQSKAQEEMIRLLRDYVVSVNSIIKPKP